MAEYSEPTWGTAQHVDVDPDENSMLYIRDPYTITGLFVQFLRSHFGVAENIKRELLQGYLWSDDVATSRIQIEPSFKVNVQNTMQRPAILVKREAVSVVPLGLGDGQHLSHVEPSGISQGMHKGVDFSNIIRGQHSVICIGQTGGEAENIGLEVLFHLLEHRYVLKKELNVGKFIVSGLSPAVKMEENQENWAATVELGWAYSHDWTLYQDSPILKKIGTVVSNI